MKAFSSDLCDVFSSMNRSGMPLTNPIRSARFLPYSPEIQNCEARKKSFSSGCSQSMTLTVSTASLSSCGSVGDLHAVFQELVDFLIRTDRTQDASVLRHFIDGNVQGKRRHTGIEMFECSFEPGFKDDLLPSSPGLASNWLRTLRDSNWPISTRVLQRVG